MSSSRRRKPLVTSRKVLTDEEESNDNDSKMTNGDVSETQNHEDIPEDLPEGTVVVEPEAVEETTFKGPEFPSSKKKVLGRPYSVIKDVVAQLCDVLVEIHMDFPKVLLLPIQGLPLSI